MLSKALSAHLGNLLAGDIIHVSAVGGGSINAVYCLQTSTEKYLLKVNSRTQFPDMFAKEALGLQVIADSKTIAVPAIIAQTDLEDKSFLILEWISTKRSSKTGSEQLGHQLAQMHRTTTENFGSDTDNYMGSLQQSNKKHPTWSAFFIAERLQPMVKIASDKHLLNPAIVSDFERLYQRLPDLFQEEPPSLIHGDLWSGNYLIAEDDTPYLIDPAVSYGHREFDIAMTTLFGGFSDDFYRAYNESFPLKKGWERRLDLWNLYPLLVHLNLFGHSYLSQVKDNLAQYL